MIGQQHLQSQLDEIKEFPHFVIFIGPKGSGKKTLIQERFDGIYLADNKVESIRKMIEMVYKVSGKIFIMPDADNMSNAARNALLKIVEECPNDNYFIMTLEDENNILETIRSRATIFHMDRYTPDEILEYAIDTFRNELQDQKSRDIIKELCETPGDVQILYKANILEFYDYVQLVVDNIAEVSIANAFKMPNKIALKDDAEGYDLRLFLKAVANIMLERAKQRGNSKELVKYCDGYSITNKCIQKLRIKGINKQMLIDTWILGVRDIWM